MTSILSNLNNFHSLEVVDRVSETQLQVGENSDWIIWRYSIKAHLLWRYWVYHGTFISISPYTRSKISWSWMLKQSLVNSSMKIKYFRFFLPLAELSFTTKLTDSECMHATKKWRCRFMFWYQIWRFTSRHYNLPSGHWTCSFVCYLNST